jgi:hypothetical protein
LSMLNMWYRTWKLCFGRSTSMSWVAVCKQFCYKSARLLRTTWAAKEECEELWYLKKTTLPHHLLHQIELSQQTEHVSKTHKNWLLTMVNLAVLEILGSQLEY